VLTPIGSILQDQDLAAMKSWPLIPDVAGFFLCGPSDFNVSTLESIPRSNFITRDPKGYREIPEYWRKLYRVAEARNELLKVGKRFDFSLFLDSDIAPPSNIIELLTRHGKDVVSPLVRVPTTNGTSWGFGYFRDGTKEGWMFSEEITAPLQKVDAVCTSCMLLSHRIMNDPRLSFQPLKLEGKEIWVGEDHGYCLAAGRLGYEIFVDTTVKVQHFKRIWNQEKLIAGLNPIELRLLTEQDH